MFLYGCLFLLAYLAYGLIPSIVSVAIVTVALRIFEYGINKPTRETILVHLERMIDINQLFLLTHLFQGLVI